MMRSLTMEGDSSLSNEKERMAKPTPPSRFSQLGFQTQKIVCPHFTHVR